jgi:hypothetical protein
VRGDIIIDIDSLSLSLEPFFNRPNPENSIPVLYDYIDGSWIGTNKPLATTTKEEGRKERGDGSHLDDHVSPVVKASTSGYLSHAKHVVRLHSLDGAVPPAEHCSLKGMVVSKPFSAYYMFYTDAEGKKQLDVYEEEWNRMVEEYTPEKLALENKADSA